MTQTQKDHKHKPYPSLIFQLPIFHIGKLKAKNNPTTATYKNAKTTKNNMKKSTPIRSRLLQKQKKAHQEYHCLAWVETACNHFQMWHIV